MMGVQDAPARLFHDFCLDEHVPSDHMLRGIDGHLDLTDLRQSLKPFYSQMGRPSVDPELMMRMLIVGYCMGIRSGRGRGVCGRCEPHCRRSLKPDPRLDGQKVGMAPHFFNDICQEGSFSDATVLSLRVAPRGPVTSALCAC